MPEGPANKDDDLQRLGRIEGQVRGLQRLVEDDHHLADILTQIAAVNRALQEVACSVLDQHLRRCLRDAQQKRRTMESLADEVTMSMELFLRT